MMMKEMYRREFLRVMGLAAAGCAGANLPAFGQAGMDRKTGRPNVLMIIADDMNDYGFYGRYPGVKTPCLDRFKQSALVFDRAYCAAPACVPSRAAVFSGMYPHRTGAYLNGSDPWKKEPFTRIEAMPECFRRNGYTTFGRGKLFHSQPPAPRRKAMWDNEVWGGGFGPFPPPKDQVKGKFWGCTPWDGPDTDFPDVKNVDAAMEFLGRRQDRPFFMVVGLWRPHTPFTAPRRFFEMYDPRQIEIPVPGWRSGDLEDVPPLAVKLAKVWGERFTTDTDQWRKFVHAYCACTTFADWSVGRLLDALDRSDYADDTIVVFWSDNGYHCGEKNHWEKNTLWEQAARTPFALRVPGMKSAGAQSPRPVSSLDIYPTLIDLCRLERPQQPLDGRSLRDLLDNPQAPRPEPVLTTYGEGYASLRTERYRYIHYPDGTEELYDHSRDPHELTNLARNPDMESLCQWFRRQLPDRFAASLGGRMG